MTIHFFEFDESVDEVVILCPNCRGKGGWWKSYEYFDDDPLPLSYPGDWIDCPECNGVGWFPYTGQVNGDPVNAGNSK